MGIGAPELLIVAGVIVLLFGGAKLPKLARSLGQAKNEFEAGAREGGKGDTADTTEAEAAEADTTGPKRAKTMKKKA
jgi:sec-independent protein translocase protein TatA